MGRGPSFLDLTRQVYPKNRDPPDFGTAPASCLHLSSPVLLLCGRLSTAHSILNSHRGIGTQPESQLLLRSTPRHQHSLSCCRTWSPSSSVKKIRLIKQLGFTDLGVDLLNCCWVSTKHAIFRRNKYNPIEAELHTRTYKD